MSIDKDTQHGRDTHEQDLTYENEQSTVTIPLKEYDSLKDQSIYYRPYFNCNNR